MRNFIRRPQSEDGADSAFQQRAFQAVLSIAEAIDDELTVSQLFKLALEVVREATGFDAVAMRIYERETHCLRLLGHLGMSPSMVCELSCMPATHGFHAEVMRTKRPAVTSDLAADPRLGGKSPLQMGYRSLACVPLLANDEIMGTMELASPAIYEWTPQQISWLSLIGRSVGVLVYQVQLITRLRDRAVVKERSLIAQEIHDGLAQQIGPIFVWAENAQYLMQEQDTDAAQIAMKKIEESARDAYRGLREEMLCLRETPAPGESFIVYLQKYLERFRQQWGIETQLVVTPRSDEQAMPVQITPAAEIQLLRIVQESLTNVRRHACASLVRLRLTEQRGWLVVRIMDDGRGFDLQQVGEEHFGLSIMRERAASVGARVTVETAPGQGTCVTVELPPRSE